MSPNVHWLAEERTLIAERNYQALDETNRTALIQCDLTTHLKEIEGVGETRFVCRGLDRRPNLFNTSNHGFANARYIFFCGCKDR